MILLSARTAPRGETTAAWIVPGIFVVAISLASLAWIVRDYAVWPWDQAWYGETALELRHAMSSGFKSWLDAMLGAMGSKPPGLPWVAQFMTPFSTHFAGRFEPAFLLVNLASQAATVLVVYTIVRRLGAGVTAAVAAMVVAGGASLAIGMTHQFVVESLQTLCFALLMWVAVASPTLSIWRLVPLLLAAVAASFLIKASSFAFVVPMLTYVVVARLASREKSVRRPNRLDAVVSVAALIGVGLTISWYVRNWAAMRQHFVNATSSNVALDYGSIGTLGSKLQFWLYWSGLSVSPSIAFAAAVAGVIGLALGLALWRCLGVTMRELAGHAVASGLLFALALGGLIAVNILGLATQINEETRFLVPFAPAFGILSGWSLTVLRFRLLAAIALAAGLANTAVGFAYAFGANPLGVTPTPWLRVVNPDPGPDRLLAEAVSRSCTSDVAGHIDFVGVEFMHFNANSASYYSARQQARGAPRCYYTSLGYAESDLQRALARFESTKPGNFVTLRPELHEKPVNFLNRIDVAFLEAIRRDPHYRQVTGADPRLIVLRRTGE